MSAERSDIEQSINQSLGTESTPVEPVKAEQSSYAHLDPAVVEWADAPDIERATYLLKHVYIRHKAVNRVHQFVEYLIRRPRSYRATGVYLCAPSGSGKTQTLRAIERQHNRGAVTSGRDRRLPILYVEVPSRPTPTNLIATMLYLTGVSERLRKTADLPLRLLADTLSHLETKAIFLDEAQNLTKHDDDDVMRDSLKEIFNIVRIPSILAGTDGFETSYQNYAIGSRWPFIIELPLWNDTPDFQMLLHSWQRALPLRLPSNLASESMRKVILEESGGLMDLIAQCISCAAIAAIRLKRECITEDLLTWWRDPPLMSLAEDDVESLAQAWLNDDRPAPDPLNMCGRHFRSKLNGGVQQ